VTWAVLDDNGSSLVGIGMRDEVTRQRELDRLKDDFVATVSHELRTPLTSMMGFLQMIREGEAGEVTAEQERFLAIVYRSSERLQRLVGDLLFVARPTRAGSSCSEPTYGSTRW
jgi:signal transduction histidine kinase